MLMRLSPWKCVGQACKRGMGKEASSLRSDNPYKFPAAVRLARELQPKLLIYSNSLDAGRELTHSLKIPFVYEKNSMQKRLKILEEHNRIITSKIFDEGMDIPGLRSIIEYDFLYGSRRQEAQRAFRLCHSAFEGIEHHILMTPEEFKAYGRRLWGLYQRGIEIKFKKT